MGGRERDAEVRSGQDHRRGAGFGRKPVHRLQLHHLVAQRADDPPAAGCGARGHRRRADDDHPLGDRELRRAQKPEPRRQAVEHPGLGGREQRQRDDPHRLLRVVGTVAQPHHRGAHQLQPAERRVDEARRGLAQHHREHGHHRRRHEEPDHRRTEHRQHHLRPQPDARAVRRNLRPVQHPPVAARGRDRRPAQPADQRMARAGRQPQPPRQQVPHDRRQQRGEHRRQRDDVGVHQPGPDRGRHAHPDQRA